MPDNKISSKKPSLVITLLLPLLLWILFSPWSAKLDLQISHLFFRNGSFDTNPLWQWTYIYGIWPAWILTGLALIGFIFSFSSSKSHWRSPCLYLLATFAIGGEVIINLCLKDHWGRPRPKQVIEFGGFKSFSPYYQYNLNGNQIEPSKSFPCGHASTGFYFFALAILGIVYQSKFLFRLGMVLAWSLGILLSLARIAQGGHFLSDTLAAALIMWLTALGLAYLFFFNRRSAREKI